MSVYRFTQEQLQKSDLIIDAIYEGGRSGNAGDDPLSDLIGVSNQGGFRYLGHVDSPQLIVIRSDLSPELGTVQK